MRQSCNSSKLTHDPHQDPLRQPSESRAKASAQKTTTSSGEDATAYHPWLQVCRTPKYCVQSRQDGIHAVWQ